MSERKTVLITGCSSGFGYLTALKFARSGWWTFASVKDLESPGAKELWEIKNKEDLPLQLLPINVDNSLSVEEGVSMVLNKSGRINVLVNNAGFGYFGPVEEFTLEQVREQYETNIFGVLRMIKAVVPGMRQSKSGAIINLSSISGRVVFPLYGVYASSKFALEALSEALRFDLSHFGVNVVLVEPGSFKTGFDRHRQRSKETVNSKETVYGDLLKGFWSRRQEKPQRRFLPKIFRRSGDPQQVADLIFKVSNQSNSRARYLVGNDAHIFYYLRKFAPNFLWEYLLHKVYKW